MPATSERQRRFMGAELGRLRAGKKTRTGMSEKQLSEFAGSVKKNPGHHGGFPTPSVGQRRQRPAPAGARSAMYGGPPAEGFHRRMPSPPLGSHDPAGLPQGRAVARQSLNPHKHLGRFATGKPRKVTSKSTAVPSGANR